MRATLKTCPFCGSDHLQYSATDFCVECVECGTDGPFGKDKDAAIVAWNTRTPDVEAQALVDALDRCEPGITGAFAFQQLHGGSYDGPTYGEELKALRAALRTEGES